MEHSGPSGNPISISTKNAQQSHSVNYEARFGACLDALQNGQPQQQCCVAIRCWISNSGRHFSGCIDICVSSALVIGINACCILCSVHRPFCSFSGIFVSLSELCPLAELHWVRRLHIHIWQSQAVKCSSVAEKLRPCPGWCPAIDFKANNRKSNHEVWSITIGCCQRTKQNFSFIDKLIIVVWTKLLVSKLHSESVEGPVCRI